MYIICSIIWSPTVKYRVKCGLGILENHGDIFTPDLPQP
jgi:hypothetical protein